MQGRARLTCPRCGAPVYATDDVCMNCGAELIPEKPPEPPEPEQGTPDYRTVPGAIFDPRSLPISTSFFDALPRALAFFSAAVSMLFNFPRLLVPVFLSSVGSLAIAAGGLALLHRLGLWEIGEELDTSKPLTWIILIPTAFLSWLVALSFMAATVHLIDAYLHGRRASLSQALSDVARNFPALAWLAALNVIVDLLIGSARRRSRSIVGRAATEAASEAQKVANLLIVPIIILEDIPLSQAFKRAWHLFRPRALDVLLGMTGLLVINRVIGLAFGIPLFVVFGAVIFNAMPLLPGLAICAVLLCAGLTLIAYLSIAYYTCLYLWARAMDELGTEQVPAPEPIARALLEAA